MYSIHYSGLIQPDIIVIVSTQFNQTTLTNTGKKQTTIIQSADGNTWLPLTTLAPSQSVNIQISLPYLKSIGSTIYLNNIQSNFHTKGSTAEQNNQITSVDLEKYMKVEDFEQYLAKTLGIPLKGVQLAIINQLKNADTDLDSLSDFKEIMEYKTNPEEADTDGDGFSDNVEITLATNPLNSSSTPSTVFDDILVQPLGTSLEVFPTYKGNKVNYSKEIIQFSVEPSNIEVSHTNSHEYGLSYMPLTNSVLKEMLFTFTFINNPEITINKKIAYANFGGLDFLAESLDSLEVANFILKYLQQSYFNKSTRNIEVPSLGLYEDITNYIVEFDIEYTSGDRQTISQPLHNLNTLYEYNINIVNIYLVNKLIDFKQLILTL